MITILLVIITLLIIGLITTLFILWKIADGADKVIRGQQR